VTVQIVVMRAAQRHGELVANLAPRALGWANLRWWASHGVRWQTRQGRAATRARWALLLRQTGLGRDVTLTETTGIGRRCRLLSGRPLRGCWTCWVLGALARPSPWNSVGASGLSQISRSHIQAFSTDLASSVASVFLSAIRRCAHSATESPPCRWSISLSSWSRNCADRVSSSTGGLSGTDFAGFRDDCGVGAKGGGRGVTNVAGASRSSSLAVLIEANSA